MPALNEAVVVWAAAAAAAMRAVCARATREIFILNARLLWLCKAEHCDADAGVGRILRKQMGNHDARRGHRTLGGRRDEGSMSLADSCS